MKDMGAIMKELKPLVTGKADMKEVNAIIKGKLNQKLESFFFFAFMIK